MRSGRLLGITHGGRAGASGSGVVRVIGPGNDHTRIRSYHPAGIRRQRYLQARSKKSFLDRPTRSGARRPSWAARTPSADATGRSCAQSPQAEPSSAWAPEPDLFLDGRCCCDQSAAHRLVRAGRIAATTLKLVRERVAAALTPAGRPSASPEP